MVVRTGLKVSLTFLAYSVLTVMQKMIKGRERRFI